MAHLTILVWLLAFAAPAFHQSELVIVKKGASDYHRPGCTIISDGVDVLAMTRAQAEGRKLKAHPACDPSKAPPESGGPATAAKSPTVYVYVNDGGKLYHRETCKRLGKDKKKTALDEAGRKHWPCPTCRPPIRKRR